MKNSNLVIGLFIGSVSISQAVKIGLPPYWDGSYSNTWAYTNHPRLVNETQWNEGQPKGYTVAMPQFESRGNNYAQQTGRMNQRQMANEWDDELLHNVGTVKSYTERSPEAYLNENTEFEHNAQTWDQVAHVDEAAVKAEGIILARQSEHSHDTVMHRTKNPLPVEVVASTLSQQRRPRQSLFQRSETKDQQYDHLHEQTSTISPYNQRDHAWSNEQYDKSHEKTWKEQTKTETLGAYSPALNQWESRQSLSQNQEKLYSVMEQNRQLYNENQDLRRMNSDFERYNQMAQAQSQAGYDHTFETKSLILPYVARNHAWNFDEHDVTNYPVYKKASPDGYHEDQEFEEPHPWPMDPNAPPTPPNPEEEFEKCQAAAVKEFTVARSPDEKRLAMKAGARCLGHRCDNIAKKDLLTAPDAPSKKTILDAQKACHIGSGTTEDQEDPKDAPPVQNIWKETDMYGKEHHEPNSVSHDYEKTRIDPRVPIKSRTDLAKPPHLEESDDDKEAEMVKAHKARDAKDKVKDDADLEKRHDADAEHTKQALKTQDGKDKEEKKKEDAKKEIKGEKKKEEKAGEEKADAKKEAKDKKAEVKEEKKADAKEDKKADAKEEKKTEANAEAKGEAKAKSDIPPELDPSKAAAVQKSTKAVVQTNSAPKAAVVAKTVTPVKPAAQATTPIVETKKAQVAATKPAPVVTKTAAVTTAPVVVKTAAAVAPVVVKTAAAVAPVVVKTAAAVSPVVVKTAAAIAPVVPCTSAACAPKSVPVKAKPATKPVVEAKASPYDAPVTQSPYVASKSVDSAVPTKKDQKAIIQGQKPNGDALQSWQSKI